MTSNFDNEGFTQAIKTFKEKVDLPSLNKIDSVGSILDEIASMSGYADYDPIALAEWAIKLNYYALFLNGHRAATFRNVRFYQKQIDTIVGQEMSNNAALRSLYGKTAERIVCAENEKAKKIDAIITRLQGELDTIDGWIDHLNNLSKTLDKLIYVKKQANYK